MSDDEHPVDVAETRNQEMWRRYCNGETQQAIADRFGLTQGRVSAILTAIRATVPRRTREQWRQEFADQLDRLRATCQEIADARPAPAYRGETPLRDPETDEPVWDHGGRLAAVDRVLKIQERTSRLLGVDEPAKIESDATVRYVVEGVNPEALS